MLSESKNLSREQISMFLADALATAVTSYRRFSGEGMESHDDSKEFKERHNACRAAIAHIELLLKLAQITGLPDEKAPNINDQVMLAAMMGQALDELNDYNLNHQDDEDGDE